MRLWLFRLMIIATLGAKPHQGLLVEDRIPVQSPGGSPIASVRSLACDVRTMLGHEMRFEDLVPLLALSDRWRLAAYRAGVRRGGARGRSDIEPAMGAFYGGSSRHTSSCPLIGCRVLPATFPQELSSLTIRVVLNDVFNFLRGDPQGPLRHFRPQALAIPLSRVDLGVDGRGCRR
jgi:hypothetical protein